ncbi:MAG: T9SS type A sorting domain-containing protein [Bacteroidales bacterium]
MKTHFFHSICKQFLVFCLFTNCTLSAFAQTYPLPMSLPVNVNFGTTHFSSIPSGFQTWIAPLCQTTDANPPLKIPMPLQDTGIRENVNTTQSSFGWYSYLSSENAKLYLQITSVWTGQMVAAINTLHKQQIVFSCALSSFGNNTRYGGLVFQYRIPSSETWYPYGFYKLQNVNTDTVLHLSLPSVCNHQSCVYLRMIAYRSNVRGESGGSVMPLLLDNISIDAQEIPLEDTLLHTSTDTVYIKMPLDTIYIPLDTICPQRDTVFVPIFKDSVLIRTDTIYKYQRDTIYKYRTDTLYIYKDTLYLPCDTLIIPRDTIPHNDTIIPLRACSLPFVFLKDWGRLAIPTQVGFYEKGLGNDYASPCRLRFDNTDDYVFIYYKDTASFLTYGIKWNAAPLAVWGNFVLEGSVDGKRYTVLRSYDATTERAFNSGSLRKETVNEIPWDTRYIRWRYANKIDGNIGLGNIRLEKLEQEKPKEIALENIKTKNYKIYPNPSKGLFRVESEHPIQLEIYTLSGQKIEEQKVNGKAEFNLSAQAKGMFFIRIISLLTNSVELRKLILY